MTFAPGARCISEGRCYAVRILHLGMIMAALRSSRIPKPSREQIVTGMNGNICVAVPIKDRDSDRDRAGSEGGYAMKAKMIS